MQLIARDVNASETAFLSGARDGDGPLRIRWFTPTTEVGFCGHATLAAAEAWAEHYPRSAERGESPLVFESAAGRLSLTPEREKHRLWWLEMPEAGLKPDHTNPMRTCELLGMSVDDLIPGSPQVRTRDDDVILFVKSWQRLTELRPSMTELRDWCARHGIRGILVATNQTLNQATQVASRFFAPAAGINEDPVTGSVHGPLGVVMAQSGMAPLQDGLAALTCVQGPPGGRAGLVRVRVRQAPAGFAAMIGGVCHIVCRGEFRVP